MANLEQLDFMNRAQDKCQVLIKRNKAAALFNEMLMCSSWIYYGLPKDSSDRLTVMSLKSLRLPILPQNIELAISYLFIYLNVYRSRTSLRIWRVITHKIQKIKPKSE